MKKILLVEDDLFIRDLYIRVLSQSGYGMSVAVNGEEGLQLALNKPDLILLDIMLPKVNGVEVLERLKEDKRTKDIPVVLVSNLGQRSIVKQALEIGARGYILKMSMTPYEIRDTVEKFLKDPTFKMGLDGLNLD